MLAIDDGLFYLQITMQKKAPDKLAIFDFDETLTWRDTTVYFLRYYAGSPRTYFAFLINLPSIVMAMNGFAEWKKAKEKIFKNIFGSHTPQMVQEYGESFANHEIPNMLIAPVWDELNRLRNEGYEILLLSASCSIWLKHWCDKENIALLCSELEVKNGRFTGKLKGENCYGPEKANRLNQAYNLDQISSIVAYGNHPSDFYYMNLAHKAYLVKGNKIIPYEKQK